MSTVAERKLFSAVTRQAVYIEQVKLNETIQFKKAILEIEKVFTRTMNEVKYADLGDLTKAQLKALVKSLRSAQTKIYTKYKNELLLRLESFMKATVKQSVISSATIYDEYGRSKNDQTEEEKRNETKWSLLSEKEQEAQQIEPLKYESAIDVITKANKENETNSLFGLFVIGGTAAGLSLLWSKLKSQPMPSGGALLEDYINTAMASNMLVVENAVTNGWANKTTVKEVIQSVVTGVSGAGSVGSKTGVLNRVQSVTGAVTATVMQYVGQQSAGAVNSSIWPGYVWASVMDDRTSDICRHRNLMHFVFGSGPLPPAHPHCRSHIVPTLSNDSLEIPGFFDWLKLQSDDFLYSVFGGKIADKFFNGTISADDFVKFRPTVPLTVSEYETRIGDLL